MLSRFTQKLIITMFVLFGLLGSTAVFADDPLPQVRPFADGVYGILLLNGENGGDFNANGNLIRYLNDYDLQDVMALNITANSVEDIRLIRDTYNADLVAWYEFDGDASRLNIAGFDRPVAEPVVQTSFARMVVPTIVSIISTRNAASQNASFLYGIEQYRSMDYFGAAATFTTIIDAATAQDDLSGVYFYRGLTKLNSYDLMGAIEDFDLVAANSDVAAAAQYHRANAYYSMGMYTEATDAYTRAIATAEMPLLHYAYATRGYLYELYAETDEAMADYTSAIDLDNTNADVYLQRANIYYTRMEYDSALRDYDRLLALSPSNITNWQRRGMVYVAMGDYDRAIEDYSTSIVLANENQVLCQCLYAHRGQIFYIAGRLEEAEADFHKSITYGDNISSHLGLAWVYTDQGKLDDAKHEIELAEALSSGSAADDLALGVAYEHYGDGKTAGEHYWNWVMWNEYESITEPTKSLTSPAELSLNYGKVYYIPVTLKAGQTLTAQTLGEHDRIDPLMVVLDSNSNPVAGSDNRIVGKDANAEIEFKATRAGEYMLVVTRGDGGIDGMMTLTWNVK